LEGRRRVPLRSEIAQDSEVTFRELPSNAISILHDLTDQNVKRRSFTIQNGQQIWWQFISEYLSTVELARLSDIITLLSIRLSLAKSLPNPSLPSLSPHRYFGQN
jgi:hypothetical protein